MNWMFLLIAIPVAALILIVVFYMEKITYKDALEHVKIGGCYRRHEDYDNPFAPFIVVKEIRYNQFNEAFVKYTFPDGTETVTRFTDFIETFNVFVDVKEGEA